MIQKVFVIALCGCGISPALAQFPSAQLRPPIRTIDRTCLPAGPARPNLPLYSTDLNEKYQEIATIDSFVSMDKCEDTTRNQLRDLQAKGQAAGADALIRVRLLSNRYRGWTENPDTPFWSVRQGVTSDYFFRATAIKYIQWPAAEPRPMEVQRSAPQPAATPAPLMDTDALRKIDIDQDDDNEMPFPRVY